MSVKAGMYLNMKEDLLRKKFLNLQILPVIKVDTMWNTMKMED